MLAEFIKAVFNAPICPPNPPLYLFILIFLIWYISQLQVRVSDEKSHFLINPFGLLYNEVTASSLVKIDAEGNIVEPGSTNFGIAKAGFVLHSAIHEARKDAKCIIHVHHEAIEAVSAFYFGAFSDGF